MRTRMPFGVLTTRAAFGFPSLVTIAALRYSSCMDNFKVGDRVICVNDDGSDGNSTTATHRRLSKGHLYEIEYEQQGYVGLKGGQRQLWCADRFALAEPAAPAPTALRANGHKPESDYILTYEGGIRAAFKLDFAYLDTLQALSRLYRGTADPDYVLDALRRETHVRDESIVLLLADTGARGSKKYAQGNYLKGSNWRQYFQAAVRHAEKIQRGREHDAEGFSHRGNFIWNVLMACHCISTGLGTDDRIRACEPKSTPTKISDRPTS